ncbi:conserved exported hypothetical protein [Arthrobacter sp. 9AX]|nr:conserved exported hypothetical protein [Arthrobacter sp. 9AX]
MKLWKLIVLGVVVSVTALTALIWAFAAYETANLSPLSHDPRLTQDKWFEILRNAVTTAAALGVGVTLFLSYRRQLTAEQTQRVAADAQLTAAKAQQTAADALDVANRQHALDQDRRRDAISSNLRERYTKVAEQLGSEHLAVRLAGIYSLAALADDWADAGFPDERQVCINLLCVYYRSNQSQDAEEVRKEISEAISQTILDRLKGPDGGTKYWGGSTIKLTNGGESPVFRDLHLSEAGKLQIWQTRVASHRAIAGAHIGGDMQIIGKFGGSLVLTDVEVVETGSLWMGSGQDDSDTPKSIHFYSAILDGGRITIFTAGADVSFTDCKFQSGSLVAWVGAEGGHLKFSRCTFTSDVFQNVGLSGQSEALVAKNLTFLDCHFPAGVEQPQLFQPTPD